VSVSTIEATYRSRTPASAARQQRAEQLLPGGDTRTAAFHPPYGLTIERGEGPYLWDVDGHRYVDLIGNFTSLVHGNAYPAIVEAAAGQVRRGTAWPARSDVHLELAEALIERVASVEQVRFCNSGSEATMLALAIAREVTGRRGVLMARYGYHGSLDEFEAGFHGHTGPHTFAAEHGDAESFAAVLAEHGDDIAAVVLEPVMGSAGLVASAPGFLARVRDAAHGAGALFVLDEVITLRLAPGGAQGREGVEPDLTAMGKIIGGGFPVGAVGGRADLMAVTDPRRGRLFHSGTFNGNPVTASAGVVSVRELTSDRIAVMEEQAQRLAAALAARAAAEGVPFACRHEGSLVQVFLTDAPPPATLVRTDGELATAFHLASLNHGLFFAGRGLMALSTVVTDELLDDVIERFAAALSDVAAFAGDAVAGRL
jgi:glutamate-1-semialdehyde 2,1-aminomutase